MTPIRYEQDAEGIVTLTFDSPDAPVNTMGRAWRAAFAEVVQRLAAEKENIAGVILASAKSSFFAGAELKEVIALQPADAHDFFKTAQALKRDFRTLDRLGKPVVACIAGAALGGGWEIALAAHHRICVDDPAIQLGLPEVTLGLIPGASGITKTVRLLGLEKAFSYLVEGRLMSPREAAELGLVHDLVPDKAGLSDRARAWIAANPLPKQPWDVEGYRIPGGTPATPRIAQLLAAAPSTITARTRGLYPAPEAVLACAVEGTQVDFDTALRIESRYLAEVAVGPVAKNMIQAFFFDLNAIRSGASRPKEFARWKPAKVGILGAGMMGSGIAWANATSGIACVLEDVSIDKAEAGKGQVARLLERRAKQGRLTAEGVAATLAHIEPAADTARLSGCDLIVEAVFEQRGLKAQVTREAEPLLAPDGIFASNTSTLPISGLARASARPERFIGLHFFSPVDRMRLVEIIKGERTSAETLAKAYDYVLAIGKTPIVVSDARGFFTSRVFSTFVMEGAAMLGEGIPAAVIENAGRLAGMPVGPLAVIDETSLALSVHVIEQTRADLAAEGKAYVAQPGEAVIERMVHEFKRTGRAGGGGFYDYPKDGAKSLWPELAPIFGQSGVTYDFAELQDRLLYRQAIESARCLEEGVLLSVPEANIGSIFGIGFPAWTGGALQFINHVGAAAFVARAEALVKRHGSRFDPPRIVREKAASGEAFR